jgi:hypothetical protein
MRHPIYPAYSENDQLIDYLSILIKAVANGRHNIKVAVGPWPTTATSNPRSPRPNYTIFLPLPKKISPEYAEKLKMFAAHEAGHVAYSFSEDDLITAMEEGKKDKLFGHVLNAFEDIRIEHLIERDIKLSSTNLLPMEFIKFRRLFAEQMGSGKEGMFKLVLKGQFALNKVDFKLKDELLEQIFKKNFSSMFSEGTIDTVINSNYQSTGELIKLTTKFTAKLRELFPPKETEGEDEGDQSSDGQPSEGDDASESEKPGKGKQSQKGKRKGKGKGEQGDDESDSSEPSKGKGQKGKGQQKKGILETAEGLRTESMVGEEEDLMEGDVEMMKELLEQLNNALQSNQGGGGDIEYDEKFRVKEFVDKNSKSNVVKKYAHSIQGFKRLLLGGWRAPKNILYPEIELGEIDPELLWKGKFKGRDRRIYQDQRQVLADGLNVLVLLDNSGSMSSYTTQLSNIGVVLDVACKATAAQSNIHSRIVYFTNTCVVAKDYEDKHAMVPSSTKLAGYQSGTPTDETLGYELPGLLSRDGDKFLVIVTDGSPSDSRAMINYLDRYRQFGVKILYIEFGSRSTEFANHVDYAICYKGDQMKDLPVLLSKDLQKVIKDHAKHRKVS